MQYLHQGNYVETPHLPGMTSEGWIKSFHPGAPVSILNKHHQISTTMCRHAHIIDDHIIPPSLYIFEHRQVHNVVAPDRPLDNEYT